MPYAITCADDAFDDIATAVGRFPESGLTWLLANRGEAINPLLGLLDAFAQGIEISEEGLGVLFVGVHLLAEFRETSAFAPLCRIMRNRPQCEILFDDPGSLPAILPAVFDGDIDLACAVVADARADSLARAAMLQTVCWLARCGRVERDARTFLVRGLREWRPQGPDPLWDAWVLSAADLGLKELRGHVRDLLDRGFADPEQADEAEFDRACEIALSTADGLEGFRRDGVTPWSDSVERMRSWWMFSPASLEPDDAPGRPPVALPNGVAEQRLQDTIKNPFRGVGRNDPCVCGSGKKYKKCCLTETS